MDKIICLVSEEFPIETPKGGIATYQYLYAKSLIKLGYEVHVICKTESKDNRIEDYHGIQLHYIPEPKTNSKIQNYLDYRELVAKKMEELKSIVDIFEVADWGAEARYFNNISNKPIFVKLHTPLEVWNQYNKLPTDDLYYLRTSDEKRAIETATGVYSCSESLAKIIKEMYKINYKIPVIPNPLSLDTKFKEKDYSSMDKVFLFVGSLEERKGVINLSKIINRCIENINGARFIFIGKDTNRNSLRQSTKELMLKNINPEYHNKIKFIGHLKNNELKKYYENSYCCIVSSLYDNLPYVVLESMKYSCPVLGSNKGGIPEMVSDNQTGLLFDPNNKEDMYNVIYNAASNPNKLNQLAQNAYNSLTKYSMETIAKDTLSYYERTINEKK